MQVPGSGGDRDIADRRTGLKRSTPWGDWSTRDLHCAVLTRHGSNQGLDKRHQVALIDGGAEQFDPGDMASLF